MKCEEMHTALVDYALWQDRGGAADEFAAGPLAEIEEHLAQCESCVRELAEVRRVMRAFDSNSSTSREAFTLIQKMFNENASSAHIEVGEFGASVKLRKQGRLAPYEVQFDVAAAELLLARLRRMMSIGLVEDCDGKVSCRNQGTEFTVHGSFFRTAWGQGAVLKLAEPPMDVTLEDTGLSESELVAARALLGGVPGLLVLCGVPDQPLRNLRFAIGSYLSTNWKHAVYDIEEFTPKQINNIRSIKASSDLNADLTKILNYDPDVISVSSVTDISALGPVIEFASRGHWVILQFPDDSIEQVADKLFESESRVEIALLLRAVARLKQAPVLRGTPDPGRYLRTVILYEGDLLTDRRGQVLAEAGKLDDRTESLLRDSYKLTLEDSASDRVARGLMSQAEADLVLRFEQCFTPEALRCTERGRELAASEASEHYTTEHLLRAMVESKEAAVRDAFEALGIDREGLTSQWPETETPATTAATPRPSPRLEDEFCVATMFAGGWQIGPRDILNAMLYWDGLGGEILAKAGGKKPVDPGGA